MNYNHLSRAIGQMYDGGLELLDFLGPVELWKNPNEFQVCMYLIPEANFKIGEKQIFRARRHGANAAMEAMELFRSACEIALHLPYEHPLNTYLLPYRPVIARALARSNP